MNKIDYTLYMCTDRDLMSCDTIEETVEQALQGGVSVVQLREKNCSSREFYDIAVSVKKITDKYDVPLIINDRADIALAADCAGVHLGQGDLPCAELREIMGDKIIGVSTATVEEAVKAKQDGADYIGVGAMCVASTKTNTRPVSKERLAEIRSAVDLPIVIIGGINQDTMMNFKGMGIEGVAVISAIVAQNDVKSAANEIRELWTK